MRYRHCIWMTSLWAMGLLSAAALGQSVGLPAPRLLTTFPMGAKIGATVEVVVSGEQLEDAQELVFSDPRITAKPKLNDAGQPEALKYLVTVAPDCPAGLHDARIMTRLGISTSRAFSVGAHDEAIQTQANRDLATAIDLPLNTIMNGVIAPRSVDFYRFEARKGQRIVVDCASRGIDSKLDATVILADDKGRDLVVERRGGAIDFTVPDDGKYLLKLHDLTFRGGPAFYYRLGAFENSPGAPLVRQPSTEKVCAFSWSPAGLPQQAPRAEVEPNDAARAERIALPCDLTGSFFPAADVDCYEFEARKGEVWWIEVASERLGLPTDPAVVVQLVTKTADAESVSDVAEFTDIPSPVRVSSNGYAYDGPPYNAGSSDVMGKLEIKQDGLYRLQLRDLFGGTRNDRRNVYRLVIRKAAPDFALVAWALHMELRNGDRNAVSKPLALRGGATMALEVVAIRRDGFDGEIELSMDGLPPGVSATGLKIPAGQVRGVMLVTAAPDAPRGFGRANFVGRAVIGGEAVARRCRLASHAWPIVDSWGEIPSPRLLADVPVSVSGQEFAPLTLAPPAEPLTVAAGQKATVPLKHIRRSEFSGGVVSLRAMAPGFERVAADVNLGQEQSEIVIDTAALRTAPGDYTLAFHGGAVARYRHRVDLLAGAEAAQKKAAEELALVDAELLRLIEAAKSAAADAQPEAQKSVEAAQARQKTAAATVAAAAEAVKKAMANSAPQEIVDIIVSQPFTLRVLPAESK